MAVLVAQQVPTSSSVAVTHGPAGVGEVRHRMRAQLSGSGVSDTVVEDAELVLSELLSNACRYARPLRRAEHGDGGPGDSGKGHDHGGERDSDNGDIRAAWSVDQSGGLTVEVTDGGGPTRPTPARPSLTARGGRGLTIISALAKDWGIRDSDSGEVTVWAHLQDAEPAGTAR
ncbi:ATP-binding protein [Streptomyces sp. NBC_01497]|uniref:ATP-binding protein n=1 Tax=Streptomyces sp. NBC_01497 TaxID=2903885 RepID=UPI002E322BC2|nr:ATP-binding protein [Streptomyces sp. NBC_01497]